MRRGYWGGLLMAAAGLAFLCGLAGTAAALDMDGIKITPSFAYKGEYDDNVFRTQFDKRTDYINYFTPGIMIEATPGRHDFKAGAKMDILRYSNHNNLDTERYNAFFKGVMKFNKLELRGFEEFRRTDDFPTTEVTQRILRNENTMSGGFDYDMAQVWGLGFDVTWDYFDYLNNSQGDLNYLDRNVYTYATNLYYRISAKPRAFVEYDFVDEQFRHDETRDSTRHRGFVGVRGDLSDRFSLSAKAGWEYVDFKSTYDSFGTPVAAVEATYKPSDRLQIAFLLARKLEVSTVASNAVYGNYTSTLLMTYGLTPKITLIPRGYFGYDDYREATVNPSKSSLPTEKRYDFNYGAGLGIRYEVLKWLRLDANYDFTRRDSNFNTSDYDDNRVNFSVTFSM